MEEHPQTELLEEPVKKEFHYQASPVQIKSADVQDHQQQNCAAIVPENGVILLENSATKISEYSVVLIEKCEAMVPETDAVVSIEKCAVPSAKYDTVITEDAILHNVMQLSEETSKNANSKEVKTIEMDIERSVEKTTSEIQKPATLKEKPATLQEDTSPPALPQTKPPVRFLGPPLHVGQVTEIVTSEEIANMTPTIPEEEEVQLRVKLCTGEEPQLRTKTSNATSSQPRPLSTPLSRPGAIARLALSGASGSPTQRSPVSIAAPRRSQSFVLSFEAAPGGPGMVNSVANSVNVHRQQFLQRRSLFEAPTPKSPQRKSRPFEIELRALKLGTSSVDGKERPNYVTTRRESYGGKSMSRNSAEILPMNTHS